MKRKAIFGVFIIFLAMVTLAVLGSKQTPSDAVEFRILRYTNDGLGLQALVQMTNSRRDLHWEIHSEFLTNGTWLRSAATPPFGSYPPMLPAKLPDMNVLIPVPSEASTWRVELEVRPYQRGELSKALGRLCRAVGVRDMFYPEAQSIKSQAFER